jgi:hypothetical protein
MWIRDPLTTGVPSPALQLYATYDTAKYRFWLGIDSLKGLCKAEIFCAVDKEWDCKVMSCTSEK